MNRKADPKMCVLIVLAAILTPSRQAMADFIFGTPTNLEPTVNSSAVETEPSISADGLTLYFASRYWPGG